MTVGTSGTLGGPDPKILAKGSCTRAGTFPYTHSYPQSLAKLYYSALQFVYRTHPLSLSEMVCLVRYLFVISTSVIDCLGRFVPEMTYYVSSGTLNLTKLNLSLPQI